MRSTLPVTLCTLALAGAFGCGSQTTGDPYEQAAQEVESAQAALDQTDSANAAIDMAADGMAAATDMDKDSDEVADEAVDGGGRHGGGPGDRGGPGEHRGGARGDRMGGGGGHQCGHHHGRGNDLLLYYADLDALQACRDLRDSCQASADPASCKDEVHACVEPILQDAFAAMCAERVTMCDSAGSDPKPCERVHARCDANTGGAPTDAGTAP